VVSAGTEQGGARTLLATGGDVNAGEFRHHRGGIPFPVRRIVVCEGRQLDLHAPRVGAVGGNVDAAPVVVHRRVPQERQAVCANLIALVVLEGDVDDQLGHEPLVRSIQDDDFQMSIGPDRRLSEVEHAAADLVERLGVFGSHYFPTACFAPLVATWAMK